VDVGVHQDGLVHISQLADRVVKNPHDVVKVQLNRPRFFGHKITIRRPSSSKRFAGIREDSNSPVFQVAKNGCRLGRNGPRPA